MSNALISNNGGMPLETPFGKYTKKSRVCPICLRMDHMEINALRGRDYLTYGEISAQKNVTKESLDLHFTNHFIISTSSQQILDLKEDSSSEANEIVNKIFEGNIDLFSALQSILEGKAQRLHMINERVKHLSDNHEIDNLDDVEKQEFILLNKLADTIEDKIVRVYQLMDKKLFPTNQEDMAKAILTYKLDILTKFVDGIIRIFIEFERNPEYSDLIKQLRISLSQTVSNLEAGILKSGGIIKADQDD